MQKNKINLFLKDYRDSFYEPNKKNPYYLFIEFGNKSFYFSNKDLAQKYITKLENKLTKLLNELFNYIPRLYELNINLTPYLDFVSLHNFRNDLNHILTNYSKLFKKHHNLIIGYEINNYLHLIYNQFIFYRDYLRKNNRFNFLYQNTNNNILSIKRLKSDFEKILYNQNGLTLLEDNFQLHFIKQHCNFLKIA